MFSTALDYVVAQDSRFPFDKFERNWTPKCGTQMKATGEVMAIGRNIENLFLRLVAPLKLGYITMRNA